MSPEPSDNVLEEENINSKDMSIVFGKILAHPSPGEEVTITGLSGQYPESQNVHEFRDNLFNKIDMVTADERRWEAGHPEIPQRTGKIPNIEKFDAGFFGIHPRQAECMDPVVRMFLEKAIEAIFDAGLHPSDLEGTNTGVFVGASFSETEKTWFLDKLIPHGSAITGCTRSMIPNRVSYYLKLKGPSFICDTACSSSLYGLEHAYKAIRTGQCDNAIVGGTNLTLHPFVSLQFARLGVLSLDGECKVFDNAGGGYVRSEAVSAVFLQKSRESKRIYATVLHAKSNTDGYKDSGITYPSGEMQVRLLEEFYEECDSVKPTDLSFLEAHGTGTKVGDPEELQAIETVFVKGRDQPLLVGSVKSNIGHTEPSSGLCSVTKVLIGFETGFIPPNIHYKTPRAGNKSLENGDLKVVTEKTPFKDNRGLIGINSFGFGGANCHILLRHNTKIKLNNGRPRDNISRLVCVSGRTKEAVDVLLDDVRENGIDAEHIGLLQEVFRKNILNHHYRGFSLVSKSGEISRSINNNTLLNPSLVICFGIIDKPFRERAREFLELPLFAGTVQRIHEVLQKVNFDIMSTLMKQEQNNVLGLLLVNLTFHLGLADILKSLGIEAYKVFAIASNLSLGNLACAYYDGAVTLKEAVDCAIAISETINSFDIDFTKLKNSDFKIYGNKNITTKIQNNLRKVLVKPRRLSNKVIFDSSSSDIAEYLTESIDSAEILKDVNHFLTKNVILFEFGNGNISDALKSRKKEKMFVSCSGGIDNLLTSVGRLYELGIQPQTQNLYPKIKFPVSRGTPMIAPKIRWDHSHSWSVTRYSPLVDMEIEERKYGVILKDPGLTFMSGHNIDGRNLFPASGYLIFVWETLAHVHGRMIGDMKVIFENCSFRRACTVPSEVPKLELTVMVQRGTGNFEVVEDGTTVVTGRIRQDESDETELSLIDLPTGVHESIAPYMNTKDVYKELRLRGYNYKGVFRGIQSCDNSAQLATVVWDDNWVTFLDNMLQSKILQEDTRLLYVPTSIARIAIDAQKHIEYAKTIGENPHLTVYLPKETGIIRSGAVEIRGLIASSIARRKYRGIPVLEKYVFVPHIGDLKTEQAVRVNVQILLENLRNIKVKVVELIDDATQEEFEPLGDVIHEALADQPLIQSDITILSKSELKVKYVKVEDKKLLTEVDCSLVVGSKILQRTNILQLCFHCLKSNAFVLSREPLDFDCSSSGNPDVTILTIFNTEKEKLVLFRKTTPFKNPSVVKVSSKDEFFSWIPPLKTALKNDEDILVCAQSGPLNGALGMVNCLRQEPGGQNVKLLYIPDSAPEFDLNLSFYKEQLEKNLAYNVYSDGKWGTYRHLLLEEQKQIPVDHCYLNSLVRGDLSSLAWLEGQLQVNSEMDPEYQLVSVYYAALNFRDVMTASGKINVDAITRDRRSQECVQGFEFSGRTQSGKRVMGISPQGACASLLEANSYMMWEVPEHWSLKDAATVPVVYLTCIFALFERGQMKRGNTILIHSGTGGIGQAAITLALHVGCTVYTTVGTSEKREFLKKKFPEITDKHIASSRDTNFESHILKATKGRGVDIVLNSLAEDKLIASVRCLAKGGRFIEIGKFDLANNNRLNLLLLEKEASFHGRMLDALYDQSPHLKKKLFDVFKNGFEQGIIKPLPNTVFKMGQVEDAFRYMTTGKHMGKVIIEIRAEEEEKVIKPAHQLFVAHPRYYCDPNKTYVILGGLGGFGLELADWLILRGCRKLVLVSRRGVKTGYQAYRISIWKSYGCTIKISTEDITLYRGCRGLIEEANKLGPVHAIFNLAVVLKDAIFENQTDQTFLTSFKPKAYATQYLDQITRQLCPELRDFVVFSSVSCGRGNAGQTNYGMANSIMERICERRKKDGFPAIAIEWGAVGDVGLVADLQDEAIEMEIGGTLQQRISNCLQVMDRLLRQNEAAVVSSMVVAEKRAGTGGADNIVDAIANILGVKDLKMISLQSTLAEIGMDSMTAVEIKQTLEREFEVYLTAQDIKTMTFARLIEIQAEKNAEAQDGEKKERPLFGMDMIIRKMADPAIAELPLLTMKNNPNNRPSLPTCVIFPGIEGVASILEPLYKNLEAELILLQYPLHGKQESIEDIADYCIEVLEKNIPRSQPFTIISYSYGGIIAIEAVRKLEERGYCGTLILIDSSPDYLKALVNLVDGDVDEKLQVHLITRLMSLQISYDIIAKNLDGLFKCNSFDERMTLALTIIGNDSPYSEEFSKAYTVSLYKRIKAIVPWSLKLKLNSRCILFKPTLVSLQLPDEDYGLSKICQDPVEVTVFEGNHATILENLEMGLRVNEVLQVIHAEQELDMGKEILLNVDKIDTKVVVDRVV